MTQEEQTELIYKARSGCIHSRTALMKQFRLLAFKCANRFSRQFPEYRDDIEQEAMLALNMAIDKCNPDVSPIACYAGFTIPKHLIRYVRLFIQQSDARCIKPKPIFVSSDVLSDSIAMSECNLDDMESKLDCSKVMKRVNRISSELERDVIALECASVPRAKIAEELGISSPAVFAARKRYIKRVQRHPKLATEACWAAFGIELTIPARPSNGTE